MASEYETANYLDAEGKRWVWLDYANRQIKSLEQDAAHYEELYEARHRTVKALQAQMAALSAFVREFDAWHDLQTNPPKYATGEYYQDYIDACAEAHQSMVATREVLRRELEPE